MRDLPGIIADNNAAAEKALASKPKRASNALQNIPKGRAGVIPAQDGAPAPLPRWADVPKAMAKPLTQMVNDHGLSARVVFAKGEGRKFGRFLKLMKQL